MDRVSPGLYHDAHTNTLHFCVAELLEAYGFVDTPANRERLGHAIREAAEARFPGVPITEED